MTLSERIMKTALKVGAVSFFAGFIGPIVLTPKSNLGPLLGIFVTGPIGFLLGALIASSWSVYTSTGRSIQTELRWYLAVWLLALLGYSFFAAVAPRAGLLPWIGFLLLALAAGIFLLANQIAKQSLSRAELGCGLILLIAATLILLMAIFPPVTEPWWGSGQARKDTPKPMFAFFMDSQFDASRHIPEFAIDRGKLALQWLITAVVAGLICLSITATSKARKPNDVE
jgi:hypothetical protein